MKYSIYFSNNNANETILTALKELNNTFFIENSNSESKKSILNNYTSDSNNNIKNLETNFNKIYLNNFEFVKNPDNYIEDKIYNDLKLKIKNFLKKENIFIILRIIVLKKSVTNSFLHIR